MTDSDQTLNDSAEDKALLKKQDAYLKQYKKRGLRFMLAATMIYQKAWDDSKEYNNGR